MTKPASIRIAWHGGASFTLDVGGIEVLVDPSFSRPGDYPPWFDANANANAPPVGDYVKRFHPAYLFITHGHFDHFDLETVRKLASELPLRVVGSPDVLGICRGTLGIARERLLSCPTDHLSWLKLEPGRPPDATAKPSEVSVRAAPAPHWFTGEEGRVVAAKFAVRPDRYGAMPCGGPMLGYVFRAARRTVYVSGDTDPGGFLPGPYDVAVVNCGGMLYNPATRELEGPWLDEATLAREASRVIRPRVLVPVHYDHPVFQTGFTPELLARALGGRPGAPALIVPVYNEWTTLVA
ncbi:MAG: MBL fold metallo-hydrolase [Bacillota bacterium]|nr:MAG: MBL fold metallo-hydrolase [Bacillota bacterium]